MVSANRQNEYVTQNKIFLLIKAVLGVALLGAGFYLATKKQEWKLWKYLNCDYYGSGRNLFTVWWFDLL